MTIFLSIDDVICLHDEAIRLFGGSPGIRDRNLLASALAQPAAGFGGHDLHESIAEKAAAYLFHIVKNHPFVDGNKRTGATTAMAFLDFNGYSFIAPDGVLFELTMQVVCGEATKPDIAAIFAKYLKKAKS